MDMNFERKLYASLEKDTVCQELLNACLALEPEYRRIVASLPSHDRDVLDLYISLCEEMDHRALILALSIY